MNDITKPANTALSTGGTNQWMSAPEDKEDLIFPRAKIFQGTPTEFKQYPNAKHGQIINHLTGELLPSTFIPFLKFKQYAKFNARNKEDRGYDSQYDPGALIWMTADPHDPRVAECKFGPGGEKPTAIEFMNFMSLFDGQDFPVIVSFAKTSLKAGKKLFSMLAFSGRGLNRKFSLSTKEQSSDGNSYYVYDVNPAGIATDEEVEKVKHMYASFAQKAEKIQVDEDAVKWNE